MGLLGGLNASEDFVTGPDGAFRRSSSSGSSGTSRAVVVFVDVGAPRCAGVRRLRGLGSRRRTCSSEGRQGEIGTGGVTFAGREREEGRVAGDVSPPEPVEAGHGEEAHLTDRVEPAHQGDPAVDGGASPRCVEGSSGRASAVVPPPAKTASATEIAPAPYQRRTTGPAGRR